MNSITEFSREFSRIAKGYAPEEVDAAIRMLVGYGAELESANAEFAEVNDELIAANDRMAAEKADADAALAAARDELAAFRTKLDDAERTIEELRAKQVEQTAVESARCAEEERRYAALCRRTRALTDALRALYTEQMPAIEALAAMTADAEIEDDVKIAPPTAALAPTPIVTEPDEASTTTFTIPTRRSGSQRIRRAAMAAAAVEPDAVDLDPVEVAPVAPTRAASRRPVSGSAPTEAPVRQISRRPAPAKAAPAVPAPAAPAAPVEEENVFLPSIDPITEQTEPDLAAIFRDAPTQLFDAIAAIPDEPIADGVELNSVYRPVSPADLKAKNSTVLHAPAKEEEESLASIRLTLEKIEKSFDDED